MSDSGLFSPLTIRGVTFRNRIGVSPMCQYSCANGMATEWHLVHLGSRAVGGAGLVIVEATAVTPEGRISPGDMGLWNDDQIAPLAYCAEFMAKQGAVPGIQLAHAGRKASTDAPWNGGNVLSVDEGGWRPIVAPSAVPFDGQSPVPKALSLDEIQATIAAFVAATKRALKAGFRVIEIHAAHGYLLHEFLSPLSNERTDAYGGSFENRTRLLREVADQVRKSMPDDLPLFVRISATDWVPGGWDLEQSVELARQLKPLGVDLIDCSSGALVPNAKIPVAPGFQVPFAERIRKDAELKTAAVGMIREAAQAAEIIQTGKADMVLLARQFLRDPYWPFHAARELGVSVEWPVQYGRGHD